jgi:hypothetical protein
MVPVIVNAPPDSVIVEFGDVCCGVNTYFWSRVLLEKLTSLCS